MKFDGSGLIIPTTFVPKGFSAFTIWPLILIRPECQYDFALIEHELVHYREQAWITPFWGLCYLLSKKFRLAAEVRAYTRQIEVGGITIEQASLLLTHYRLNITQEQALQALIEHS